MAYPRRCPLCEIDYRGAIANRVTLGVPCEDRHATLSAEPGGTPSPWRPALPGRLLTLRCWACRGEYAWDYFRGRPPAGAVPAPRRPQRAARRRRRPVALPGSPSRVY
jgi:hypothetical protein